MYQDSTIEKLGKQKMEVMALTRYARISPSKMRDLASAIRGLPVQDALKTIQHSHRKGALLVLKTLKSAIANAENNAKLSGDTLHVKEAVIEAGPTLKRYRPCARGMAHHISKRTSHIKIVLAEKDGGKQ